MRILVIDDQPSVTSMVARMLSGAGHEVVELNDAKSELSKINAADFDVLITDMLMPGIDGVEVIKRLRQTHPELWIIAMSGGGQLPASYTLKLSEAFGADRILYKPFRKADLIKALEKA